MDKKLRCFVGHAQWCASSCHSMIILCALHRRNSFDLIVSRRIRWNGFLCEKVVAKSSPTTFHHRRIPAKITLARFQFFRSAVNIFRWRILRLWPSPNKTCQIRETTWFLGAMHVIRHIDMREKSFKFYSISAELFSSCRKISLACAGSGWSFPFAFVASPRSVICFIELSVGSRRESVNWNKLFAERRNRPSSFCALR